MNREVAVDFEFGIKSTIGTSRPWCDKLISQTLFADSSMSEIGRDFQADVRFHDNVKHHVRHSSFLDILGRSWR